MTKRLWWHGPQYCEDGEGGVVAVVESRDEGVSWRMTGIVATDNYGTARDPRDGVDQLVKDIQDRHVHRRISESCYGIERVESETYDSCEDADSAAHRWLDDHVC